LPGSQAPGDGVDRFRLFQDLAGPHLHRLSSRLKVRHFRVGEFVVQMGERAETLYFLDAGAVKVSTISPTGEERILDVLKAGDTLGELFIGPADRWTALAQAVSPLTVRTIQREAFVGLMRADPIVCLNYIHHLVEQQRRIHARLEALVHSDPGLRVLALLAGLADRGERAPGDRYTLPAKLTQGDLARMIGLNRSTVSMLINAYRRRGLLGGERGTLVIHWGRVRAVLRRAGLTVAAPSGPPRGGWW